MVLDEREPLLHAIACACRERKEGRGCERTERGVAAAASCVMWMLLCLACACYTPLLSQSNSNESYACNSAESSNVIGVPMGPKEEEGRVSREWGLWQSCCGYGCAAAPALRVPNAVPITRICITKAR